MEAFFTTVPSSVQYFFGLFFIIAVFALLDLFITEGIAGIFRLRSKILNDSIKELLGDNLSKSFYDHPYIKGLFLKNSYKSSTRSYIPLRVFSSVLLDIIPRIPEHEDNDIKSIKTSVDQMSHSALKELLLYLIGQSNNEFIRLKNGIECWFKNALIDLSVQYQKRIQLLLLVVAIFICTLFNADSIHITNTLLISPAIDTVVKQIGQEIAKRDTSVSIEKTHLIIKEINKEIEGLKLLGWSFDTMNPRSFPTTLELWLLKAIGILLTSISVAFVAPILFQIISKVANIRSAEQKDEFIYSIEENQVN